MADYSWGCTTVTGNISVWESSGMTYIDTGHTSVVEETPEESRTRKKKLIKSIVDDDKYLLQELLTELRNEKIEQLKNAT